LEACAIATGEKKQSTTTTSGNRETFLNRDRIMASQARGPFTARKKPVILPEIRQETMNGP